MANKDSDYNIFEDLGFESSEAANLKIRANLLIQLREYIRNQGLKQEDAAKRLGITQPDVSAIMNGKIQLFSIDKLINLLSQIGFRVEIDSNSRRRTFSVIDGGKKTHHKQSKAHLNVAAKWDILEA